MVHPDEGTIHAWLDGALGIEESEALRLHVEGCDHCSAAVAEARGFIAASTRILTALDDVPGDVLPAPVGSSNTDITVRRWRPSLAAAAAVLLMLTGGVYVVNNATPKSNPLANSVALSREISATADSVSHVSELQQAPAATSPRGIVGSASAASGDRSTPTSQSSAVAAADLNAARKGAGAGLTGSVAGGRDTASSVSALKSAAQADVAAVPPTLPATPPVPPPSSAGAATSMVAEQMQRAPERVADRKSADSAAARMQRAAPMLERARTANQGASFAPAPTTPTSALAGCYDVNARAGDESWPTRIRLGDSSVTLQNGNRRYAAFALDAVAANTRTYQWEPMSESVVRLLMLQDNIIRPIEAHTDSASAAAFHLKRIRCP